MRANVEKFGAPGIVPDLPSLILPDGVWSDSRNVRYRDGAVEKQRGYAAVLGSLSGTATWAAPISDGGSIFWVYGTATVLYATDGSTHADVSHLSLTYAASDDLGWTGGGFHGFMIANEANKIPQQWAPSLGNDFSSLSNWPTNLTAKVIRPFGDFIFALRTTTAGAYNPREIRWSDKAAQGAVPGSWDYTDPTNQAGITELGQTPDLLVDALPLRNNLAVYKEFHTWVAEYVGSDDIFGFRQILSEAGLLTENCVRAFHGKHVVWTDSDIILFDGNDAQSLANRRVRRWLFGRINTDRFKRCFTAADYRAREMYFCFPESGQDWPTLALVWNWAEDSFHPFELGGAKTFGVHGIIPTGSSTTFAGDTGTFDGGAAGAFDEETYNPSALRLVWLAAASMRAFQNDEGETYAGTAMTCYAERTGLTLSKDFGRMKRVKRIIPNIEGTVGDTISFQIGTRTASGAATVWQNAQTFTIGSSYKLDCRVSGRIIDLRVQYSGSNTFRLAGFGVEFDPDGSR